MMTRIEVAARGVGSGRLLLLHVSRLITLNDDRRRDCDVSWRWHLCHVTTAGAFN